MTTTIRTNSKELFNAMNSYLYNKRVQTMRNLDDEHFSLSVFGLSKDETDKLIELFVKRFHLKPVTPLRQAA